MFRVADKTMSLFNEILFCFKTSINGFNKLSTHEVLPGSAVMSNMK